MADYWVIKATGKKEQAKTVGDVGQGDWKDFRDERQTLVKGKDADKREKTVLSYFKCILCIVGCGLKDVVRN